MIAYYILKWEITQYFRGWISNNIVVSVSSINYARIRLNETIRNCSNSSQIYQVEFTSEKSIPQKNRNEHNLSFCVFFSPQGFKFKLFFRTQNPAINIIAMLYSFLSAQHQEKLFISCKALYCFIKWKIRHNISSEDLTFKISTLAYGRNFQPTHCEFLKDHCDFCECSSLKNFGVSVPLQIIWRI